MTPARSIANRIRRDKPGVTLIDLAEETVEACVLEFADKILHGSAQHQSWLTEAARAYVDGRDVPEIR